MARSKGYRPRASDAAECRYWRAELGKLRSHEWVKAMYVMQNITQLSPNRWGPSGGLVAPRACSVCDFFGHTKGSCPVQKARKERMQERELVEEAERVAGLAARSVKRGPTQAETFDAIRLPWCATDVGPIWSFREGDPHAGKWTYRDGQVVERCAP